jgi:hypothetical protein
MGGGIKRKISEVDGAVAVQGEESIPSVKDLASSGKSAILLMRFCSFG